MELVVHRDHIIIHEYVLSVKNTTRLVVNLGYYQKLVVANVFFHFYLHTRNTVHYDGLVSD